MPLCTYLANKYLQTLDATSFSVSTCYVKLHISNPGVTAGSGGATLTLRKAMSWGTASGGTMANDGVVTWTTGDVQWAETYTHISIWDSASGGNPLLYGQLVQPKTVAISDSMTFAVGSLTFTAT